MAVYIVNVSRNIADQESNIVETTPANYAAGSLTGDACLVVNTAATVNKDEILRMLDMMMKGIVQSTKLAG